DLRNPLTIIKTASESMARKGHDATAYEEHCRVIRRNIDKAERTISALLDIGKPRQPSSRRHDIHQLIAEVIALVRPEADHRRIGITHERNGRLLLDTDQKLFVQALLNLV